MYYEIHFLVPAVYWIIGVAIGYAIQVLLTRASVAGAQRSAKIIEEDARVRADALVRDAEAAARERTLAAQEQTRREAEAQRKALAEEQARIDRRGAQVEEKQTAVQARMAELDAHIRDLQREKEALIRREDDLARAAAETRAQLEQIAGLRRDEARQRLLAAAEEDIRQDAAASARRILGEARQNAEREARKVIATAVQRYAADQIHEMTTATVTLPNEEMKGRIIGREGRNIRSLEAATGVNVLIDDTPATVTLSGFDPVRREIARLTIERLVQDGRIHPSTIEETAAKVRAEIDETIRRAGEAAALELNLADVHPEVTAMVGRLQYRHSYGQNILKHSKEMAHIMAALAAELGQDTAAARRIGLLHDLGKAMDHTAEGSHALAAAEFLRRHGESPVVCNAVAAHHNEVEPESILAILTKAADAITAARPGARSETTEIYFKRLEKLEQIADQFPGVDKSYAIQAGRELRVIVKPGQVSDAEALLLARDLCRRIEKELTFPGQIKITVVRETRCVEYAR